MHKKFIIILMLITTIFFIACIDNETDSGDAGDAGSVDAGSGMSITYDSTAIPAGGTVNVGDAVSDLFKMLTFTVENIDYSFIDIIDVTIDNTNDFKVYQYPSETISTSGTADIVILFTPVGAGAKTGEVSIEYDNGLDMVIDPYTFTIDGNSLSAGWQFVGSSSEGFSAGEVSYTDLSIDSGGTPYVSYQDSSNADKATVMSYNGTNWVAVGAEGFTEGTASYTSLFVYDGTPYLAFIDVDNSYYGTVMKYTGSGTYDGWEYLGTRGFTEEAVYDLELYVYDNGTATPDIYVAYSKEEFYSAGHLKVMKYTGSGATQWSYVGNPVEFTLNSADYPRIVVEDGIVYTTCQNYGNAPIVYKYTAGDDLTQSWANIGNITSTKEGEYISLEITNGVPYIAYRDCDDTSPLNEYKLSVQKCPTETGYWEYLDTQQFTTGTVSHVSLDNWSLDDALAPISFVAYRDNQASSGLTVMKYIEGFGWDVIESTGFTGGNSIYTKLIVYNDNGTPVPYVVYTNLDYTNQAVLMKYGQN